MKRIWGIRHVRWFMLNWQVQNHVDRCRSIGWGFWMNPKDQETLDAIWEGKA